MPNFKLGLRGHLYPKNEIQTTLSEVSSADRQSSLIQTEKKCAKKSCLFSQYTNHHANPKTVNTRIISGMFLCCDKKANQMQDKKTAGCNGNLHCCLRFLISYLIGRRTIKMSKSNQSVHGFWIRTVIQVQALVKNIFRNPPIISWERD